MDGVSVAASVISIATAGIQISVRLITLSTQISSASERVSAVANDVSLTAGILHQLGELMTQKVTGDGVSIFSQGGLETTRTSAAICERIFQEVEREFGRASTQLRSCKKVAGGRIKLSRSEKLKWPFLQPSIDLLRADLREAKGTLMLMLQVATLALSKKMADSNASASIEQGHMFRAIVALRQQQDSTRSEDKDLNRQASEAESNFPMGMDDSPTLTRASSSHVTLATLLPNANTPSRIKDYHYQGSRPDGPADATSTSIATGLAEHPKELTTEDFNSSSATLATSPSTFKHTNTSITSSSVNDYTSIKRMRVGGQPSDDQVQSPHSPNKGTKSTTPKTENGSDSERLPVAENVELPTGADPELRMFMLKPIVKDFFDKIELSWSVQNPRMHVSAIKNHLKRMEMESLPSVMDMLETLYDHEHSIIDVHQGQGELLSLKRTKTDIQHKDIVFKGVPGLQFVVEPRKLSDVSMYPFESPARLPTLNRSRSYTMSAVQHDQPAQQNDRADLQGLLLNEQGFVLGKDGFPIAKLVTGILEAAVGRPLNAQMQIVDDFNRVVASCELLPKSVPNVTSQGPFAPFTDCVVGSTGQVKDETGDIVGRVILGNVKRMAGSTVDKDGRIVDESGQLQGRAVLLKDYEEWTPIRSPPEPKARRRRAPSPYDSVPREDASVFEEIKSTLHAEKEYAQKVDEFIEMDEAMKKQVSDKERRYREHEVELQARRYELQMLEKQRSGLEEEKLSMETAQASNEDKNELTPKVMRRKNRKALGLESLPAAPTPPWRLSKEELKMEDSFDDNNQRKNNEDDKLPSTEIFKSFRVPMDESVDQVLPAALKKYNIKANASDYELFIKYEDTELVLGREEQPLLIFRRLQHEGRNPQFGVRRRSTVEEPQAKPTKPVEDTSEVLPVQLNHFSFAGEASRRQSFSRDSPKRAPIQDEPIGRPQSETDFRSQVNSFSLLAPSHSSQESDFEKIPQSETDSYNPMDWDKPDSFAVRRNRTYSGELEPTLAELGQRLHADEASAMELADAEPLRSVAADDVDAELYECSEAEEEYSGDEENDDGKARDWGPAGCNLESEKNIVDSLLNKYTTLFDKPTEYDKTSFQIPGGIL